MLKSDNVVCFDIDYTLILWDYPEEYEKDALEFKRGEVICKGLPHFKHIKKLKESYVRGHEIYIWSAGGWEFAEAAVKILGLEEFVRKDHIICKPRWLYDDETPTAWCRVIYFPPPWEKK